MHDGSPLEDYPKTVVLTDGTHVTLRPALADDRGRLEALRARAGGFETRQGAVVILAVVDQRAVGALVIERSERGDGSLGVALDPDYCGRRLGTWMLLDAVHLATDMGLDGLVVRAARDQADLGVALDRLDFRSDGVGADGSTVFRKTLHRGWPGF